MSSYIVIVTYLATAGDFDVVGAFTDEDDAIEWTTQAFHDPRWKDCLFRVKRMRSRDEAPNHAPSHSLD